MPAISPARLKIQSIELAHFYSDSNRFIKVLYDILERYSDRSYRAGKVKVTRTIIPALKTPIQVIKQISNAVLEAAGQDHQTVLSLCNVLWQEPNFECKMLAGRLLGQLPNLPDAILLDTIREWQPFTVDEELQRHLFQGSLPRLVKSGPDQILELADGWLHSRDYNQKKTGLLLLESIVNEPDFDNSPAIFRRVSPLFRQAPIVLRPTILSLLDSLARNFPKETTYVLAESLNAPDNPDTYMLIRQVMDQLSPGLQESLRKSIQEYKNK